MYEDVYLNIEYYRKKILIHQNVYEQENGYYTYSIQNYELTKKIKAQNCVHQTLVSFKVHFKVVGVIYHFCLKKRGNCVCVCVYTKIMAQKDTQKII